MFTVILKISVCILLVVELYYFIDSDYFSTETIIDFITMLATALICFFTFSSVKEVIKSNKQNEESNKKNIEINNLKIATEIFDKKFALLLQEHKYYLGLLLKDYDLYIKNDKILKQPGLETLDVIRGEVKSINHNSSEYIFLSGELYISIKSILDNRRLEDLFPSMPSIMEDLKKKLLDINSNKNSHHCFISLNGKVITGSNCERKDDFCYSDKGINYTEILHTKLKCIMDDETIKKVKESINRNNMFAKNTISPYMRIIYHILKLSYEHAIQLTNTNNIDNKKEKIKLIKTEMKKNTNIIRSVIPNNILLLIAINSLFFYRNNRDKLYMFNDTDFIEQTDIKSSKEFLEFAIFNDYKKYYNLLILSDFFEHLYIEQNENAYGINPESFPFSFNEKNTKKIHLDKNIMIHGKRNGILISNLKLKDIIQHYKNTSNIFYLNNTKSLIYIFYRKHRSDIQTMLTDNIDDVIRSHIKEKKLNKNTYITTTYDERKKELELYPDFAVSYSNGLIIDIKFK